MNANTNEVRKLEQLTTEEKNRATEIARLIARLSEPEQDKIYYMLKGSEIFNGRAVNAAVGGITHRGERREHDGYRYKTSRRWRNYHRRSHRLEAG